MMSLRVVANSVFGILTFVVLAMATGLISANVRKLADKHAWDNFLVRGTDKLRWERVRGLWWLWSIFGLSGGVALALWVYPTSPSEIRMGPRTAIKISTLLTNYAQEKATPPGQQFGFAVIITAPPENSVIGTFLNELFLMAHTTHYVRMLPPPGENDVGPLRLPTHQSRGIIIHGNSPYVSGIATTLGECFVVSTNDTLPQELTDYYKYISPTPQFIWVRIGHGSPWKQGTLCQS
jgi:hypothetical protein